MNSPVTTPAPNGVHSDTPAAGDTAPGFDALDLPAGLLQALTDVGYENPTPIQQRTIPPLLAGRDVLGHAPTGTGKTAAFALPLIAREMRGLSGPDNAAPHPVAPTHDPDQAGGDSQRAQQRKRPRQAAAQSVKILVLTPTRELAIQVAEAFRRYAKQVAGFSVVPIYGGQDYTVQLRQLQRGAQVVVGTPGRVMDHMRRGTLNLDALNALVLDEADEMLRMGFIDDVDWILEQAPKQRQMALFSATMPRVIRTIARRHQNEPVEIAIDSPTSTAATISQRYWLVSGLHKLDALTRILEHESFDAVLVFVRTRTATVELAERLEARGHRAAAINGDLPQKQRERLIDQFRRGSLDILVATDVAARGLDVERVSHVINYDIPYDTEAYVHRIGRTGRAGRHGEAILFVTPRERRMLHNIERITRQRIGQLELPTTRMVNDRRIAGFKQRISESLGAGPDPLLQRLVEEYQQENNVPATDIAAALARLVLGDQPLLLKDAPHGDRTSAKRPARPAAADARGDRPSTRPGAADRSASSPARPAGRSPAGTDNGSSPERPPSGTGHARSPLRPATGAADSDPSAPLATAESRMPMEPFRVEVGAADQIEPRHLVGAIANEAGIDAQFIGRIDIHDDHSLVELPIGMPKAIFQDLKKAWVGGKRLRISRVTTATGEAQNPRPPGRSQARAAAATRAGSTTGSAGTPSTTADGTGRPPERQAGRQRTSDRKTVRRAPDGRAADGLNSRKKANDRRQGAPKRPAPAARKQRRTRS